MAQAKHGPPALFRSHLQRPLERRSHPHLIVKIDQDRAQFPRRGGKLTQHQHPVHFSLGRTVFLRHQFMPSLSHIRRPVDRDQLIPRAVSPTIELKNLTEELLLRTNLVTGSWL
jgi:hypothetical protein